MLTIGMDAHSRTHVAVALTDQGQLAGRRVLPNTQDAWQTTLAWAQGLDGERQWGIEGAWSYGRGIAQFLVAQGERVCDINPRWTAARRERSRRADKTDTHDALAIARLTREEGAALPPVHADDITSVLAALTTERDQAVQEATRLRNQLSAVWRQLTPDTPRPRLETAAQATALATATLVADDADALRQTWAATIRRLAGRLAQALADVVTLGHEIEQRAAPLAPLLAIPGVGPLTAGMLAGHLGPGRRFTTDAQVAAHAGVAPLEASSAGHIRHRLNRGGNRQFNAILHRIALTQARCSPLARAYLERRQTADHKTWREAIRALKRYLARRVFHAWQQCLDHRLLSPLAT